MSQEEKEAESGPAEKAEVKSDPAEKAEVGTADAPANTGEVDKAVDKE